MNTMSIRWDDTNPTTIRPDRKPASTRDPDAQSVGRHDPARPVPAPLAGLHRRPAAACPDRPDRLRRPHRDPGVRRVDGEVAQTFPTVHDFVVMNECNQPLFLNPQWKTTGLNQSAEVCGRLSQPPTTHPTRGGQRELRVGSRALTARQRPADRTSESSTSPVKFLGISAPGSPRSRRRPSESAADGRLRLPPISDPAITAIRHGLLTVTMPSVSNLTRIYQAFYTGFNRSPQKTIGQQTAGGLPVSLDETGIQTSSAGKSGYTGRGGERERGGGIWRDGTDAYQATYYSQLLDYLVCDPNMRSSTSSTSSTSRTSAGGRAGSTGSADRAGAEAVGRSGLGMAERNRGKVPGQAGSLASGGTSTPPKAEPSRHS